MLQNYQTLHVLVRPKGQKLTLERCKSQLLKQHVLSCNPMPGHTAFALEILSMLFLQNNVYILA